MAEGLCRNRPEPLLFCGTFSATWSCLLYCRRIFFSRILREPLMDADGRELIPVSLGKNAKGQISKAKTARSELYQQSAHLQPAPGACPPYPHAPL